MTGSWVPARDCRVSPEEATRNPARRAGPLGGGKAVNNQNYCPSSCLGLPPRTARGQVRPSLWGHLLAFDNLSDLPAWVSDALCRLRAMAALRFASSTRIAAIQDVVDGDPVAARIRDIVAERTMWMAVLQNCCGSLPPSERRHIFDRGRLARSPKRLQAGSGPRAQRYPLRPFSIVSAYPPTESYRLTVCGRGADLLWSWGNFQVRHRS